MKKFLKNLIPRRHNPLHWRKMAYRDTHGLKNRAWLFDTAERLYESKKDVWDFLLLYIDLKNFKAVNDSYSHSAGNEVLKQFYALLESKFRTHEPKVFFNRDRNVHEKDILVVREGGDEFIVFLPLGSCDAHRRAKAIEVIESRLAGLRIAYKKIEVGSRVAMVASSPDKNYETFMGYFEAADHLLSQIHKKEKP